MSDEGKRSVSQSIRGADRAFRVIDGGGSGDTPPSDVREEETCPVQALGHLDGTFHFLDAAGQKRALTARALGSRSDVLALFLGDDGWLRGRFPRYAMISEVVDGTEQQVRKVVDFAVNRAGPWLQSACGAAGLFGDHIVLRRAGIWTDDQRAPVVHCGDMVLINGDWHPAGARTGRQIWAAAPAMSRPVTPCDYEVAEKIQFSIRDLWNFREPGGEIAVMGLIANGYYGAAPRWRPNGFLTGGAGSGKSTLLRLIAAALPMHHFSNDTTKAGLEQAVSGRAMPSLIDESSDRVDQNAARALLDLVLSASGDEGTKGHRGGVDGHARKVEVVGSIVMATINPPEMKPQHLARFTMVELRGAETGADHRNAHEELIRRMQKFATALWGRALASWERYCEALATFRTALGKAGCAPREMDQVGALLAGWWVLVRQGLPDERGALEGVGALTQLTRRADDVAEMDGPQRMLQHLLGTMVQLHRSTDRDPMAKLIELAFDGDDYETSFRQRGPAAELLENYGIRIVRAADKTDRRGHPVPRLGDGDGLWFSNTNPELQALFRSTDFEGQRWRSEMLRLDTARSSPKAIRIGKMSTRAVWLSRRELQTEQVWEPP